MKSPYESRLFCTLVSTMCVWFIYKDWTESHKLYFMNLIIFLCTTYLALHKKKTTEVSESTCIKTEDSSEKKTSLEEFNTHKELQLTQTFKK